MTPEQIESAIFTYRFINTAAIFISLINSSLLLILFFRKSPSLDTQIANLVTTAQCRANHEAEGIKRAGIYNQFRDGEKAFKEIERSLGRIEGKVENMEKALQDHLKTQYAAGAT